MKKLSIVIILALIALPAFAADELSVMAGTSTLNLSNDMARAWKVDYRKEIGEHFAISGAYMNEGHLPGHKRDGLMGQAWIVKHVLGKKGAIGIGAGVYRYYNTVFDLSGRSVEHGFAPIITAAGTYNIAGKFFVRAEWNRVQVGHYDTDCFLVGLGVRL